YSYEFCQGELSSIKSCSVINKSSNVIRNFIDGLFLPMEQYSRCMKGKFAVVTGSSQGLGKSFAYELAKDGWNLIMISLPYENLTKISKSLSSRFGIRTFHYETDLAIKENV